MQYAVIMAGGAGKRLWPLSRVMRPKQLLPLIDGRCLLEMAVERLMNLFDIDKIWVVTNAEYADQVAATLPNLPVENIIGEPEGRDTANAIALAASLIRVKDPQATMAVFTADHVIRPVDAFAAAVRTAMEAAQQHPDALLTFGIRPTWPHTGLGYIHFGKALADDVHEVEGFKEKPDHQTARQYVESGQYYWNSGMFVWQVQAICQALEQFLGESMSKLQPVAQAALEGKDYTEALEEAYPSLEKISIDYAVMEKAQKVLVVELKADWLDVGSWPALSDVCALDGSGNVVVAKNCTVVDSFRNVVVTEDDHLLAILGMDDCIIVHSPDATLVCNKSDSQRLKDMVGYVEERYGKKYL